MARGKKKGEQKRVVAPEPAGNEWEAELQWDRVDVAPEGAAPSATSAGQEDLFGVTYTVKEASPLTLRSERPGFRRQRAVDVFRVAEDRLKQAKAAVVDAGATLAEFDALGTAELADAVEEKRRLSVELSAAVGSLEDAEEEAERRLEKAEDWFFDEQRNLLERLYQLIAHDHEIEGAFNERVATLAECERVKDCYYKEHGEHVARMEGMQVETAAMQQRRLEDMRRTLQQTVTELLASAVIPDTAAASPTADPLGGTGRAAGTLLVDELARADLPPRRGGRGAARADDTTLRRMVELEEQRVRFATRRNAALKKALAELRATPAAAEADGAGAGRLSAGDAMTSGAIDVASGTANDLAEARRRLDTTTQELAAAKEELWRLTQYHLAQLSGQSKAADPSPAEALEEVDNFLDAETNAAVRATVTEAMIELDTAMAASSWPNTADEGWGDVEQQPFAHLFSATTLKERRDIQNFVVRRINRLFTCKTPHCPPDRFSLE